MLTFQQVDAQQSPPEGFPFMQTYRRGDFVGSRQTYGIFRADDGLLYFGNTRYGIQESDGLSWRNMRMEGNSPALSFANHPDGDIYVGGQFDFGVLRKDSLLRRSYQSLAYLLADSVLQIKDVEFTYLFNDDIHFISKKLWYTYSHKEHSLTWKHNDTPVISVALWRDEIVSLQEDGSLLFTSKEASKKLVLPKQIKDAHLMKSSTNRLMVWDRSFKLWEFGEEEQWSLVADVSATLKNVPVSVHDFLWTDSGYLVIATSNGLYIFDQKGSYLYTIYESDGLCNNFLIKLYQDKDWNVWVSSLNGVSVLEFGRGMREFLPSQGLPEQTGFSQEFNGNLYLGGFNGMYVWENGRFKQIFTDQRVYTLKKTKFGLLVGGMKGLFLLDTTGRFYPLYTEGIVDMVLVDREHPNVVYFSHFEHSLRKLVLESPTQYKETKLADHTPRSYTLHEDRNGDLWIGTGSKGDFHFVSEQTNNEIISIKKIRQFTTANGLPTNGFNYTMEVGNDVGFITSNGFYRLTENRDSIVIDDRFAEIFKLQDKSVWPVTQDKNGGIWLAWAAAHIGKAVYNPQSKVFDWYDGEFTRTAPYRDIDFILPSDKNRVYLQTYAQKLAYFDSTLRTKPLPEFKAHINSVVLNKDSILLQPRGLSSSELETPITYEHQKIRFNYGMIAFLPEDRLYYQIKLEGLDKDWSDWTSERYRDYTNLAEGNYTFKVKGGSLYPKDSELASFSFRVLPPWYRTLWAYAMYMLIGFGGLWGFVSLRERQLLKRQDELEHEVLDRTKKLKQANEFQKRFFANVSHEFRTPLTISEGVITKILDKDELPNERTRYDLWMAKRNMLRLHDMVNQIIELTKADHHELILNKKNIVASDLVNLCVESFRSLAEYHGHTFIYEPSDEDIVIEIDQSNTEIMINNLISNAIKYTPDGGNIIIKTFQRNGYFVFSIADNGLGIPEEKRESIFERFHRISQPDGEYVEGMGVGLELSRTLARMHAGDITVEANHPKGSVFELKLPISTNSGEVYRISEQIHFLERGKEAKQTKPVTLKDVNVLLVEDNDDLKHYISSILEQVGSIEWAKNGREAIEKLETIKPDIIITDLMMPEMNGTELIQILSEHEKWKDIPVVVLTAKALDDERTKLLRIGVVDYITKPFSAEQLVLKTQNLLKYYQNKNVLKIKLTEDELNETTDFAEKVAVFISENIKDTTLSVDTIATTFAMSRSTFYRSLQIETGMSPAEFIREVRLTKARDLVSKNKTIRLEELANMVGYKSATSFRKMYQERFGEHPIAGK